MKFRKDSILNAKYMYNEFREQRKIETFTTKRRTTGVDGLIIHCFTSRSIIVHSYRNVIIVDEGLQN
jgi:predicted phosphoribosyltransferase